MQHEQSIEEYSIYFEWYVRHQIPLHFEHLQERIREFNGEDMDLDSFKNLFHFVFRVGINIDAKIYSKAHNYRFWVTNSRVVITIRTDDKRKKKGVEIQRLINQ